MTQGQEVLNGLGCLSQAQRKGISALRRLLMSIFITKEANPIWGNCAKMSNGFIELLVTLDYGPRIIHFSRVGFENLMYEDLTKSTLGEKQDAYDDHLKLYGGHRLWISPEILPRCYYPDSYPVEMEELSNGAIFTAPPEKLNNIQKSIQVCLSDNDSYATIGHTVKNTGAWDIEFSHWSITMLSPGGKEIIPMPQTKTGLLANRAISLWDYSEMNDPRVYWGKNYIVLKQDPSKANPFKLGINSADGWAAYFNRGQVFIKSFEVNPNGFYPDNGCSFESYTNANMLECEALGEFVSLEPGEESTVYEDWEVYEAPEAPSDNEDDIEKAMKKYFDEE
jgi:hypothetical protein